jgi:uncharacterized protein
MPRPVNCRRVGALPAVTQFKPRGVPLRDLEIVTLSLDEVEALRLADLQGRYQEEAATCMGVSRQTFGRIVANARRKVAECLIQGKALEMQGGNVVLESQRTFQCLDCSHVWQKPYGTGRPQRCPACQGGSLRRQDSAAGRGPVGACGRSPESGKGERSASEERD